MRAVALAAAAAPLLVAALGLLAPGAPESLAAPAGLRLIATADAAQVIAVPRGGDLQGAIDRAAPGDVIELEPGAVYTGPFTLPAKPGADWIVVKTAAREGEFPPAGQRVTPAHARLMPKLIAASGSVISADAGAHHYRFVGLEIAPKEGVALRDLVELSGDATTLESVPHHIAFERCYLHGDPKKGTRRGIALNGRDIAVTDSYLADFKEVGADSQALAGWTGPGPFRIVNNYLEAAGENVMFGGADPSIPRLVPSDIEIRRNHLAKPLAWKRGAPGYEGTEWSVKNLLELKNARRVVIEGNLLEHNWRQSQNGFAILFTVRNQDGRAPWSTVEDVTFENNVVRKTGSAINILGQDDNQPSQRARRIAIRNNLFEDVGGREWGGGGVFLQILNGAAQVVVEHNTVLQTGHVVLAEGPPAEGFVFRNNIAAHNAYGIMGTGTSPGEETIQRYFPGSIVQGNVFVGGEAARYPRGNAFVGSWDDVRFVDRRAGNYRLAPDSRLRTAAGGAAPGANLEALTAAGAPAAAGRPAS